MTDRQAIEDDVERYVSAYLEVVQAAQRAGYRDVGALDELPPAARAQSAAWCRGILSAEADPYRREAAHAYHPATAATYDLLRHTAPDGSLVVVESRIFAALIVPGGASGFAQASDDEGASQLAAHAARLFTGPAARATWQPRASGAGFSTAPGEHPLTMPSPGARLDAGAVGDDLYFLTYRVSPAVLGGPDPRSWFEPSHR